MKIERKNELRRKSVDELKSLANEMKIKLEGLVFELRAGRTSQVKEIKKTKKEIAFILTVIKEYESKK